MERTFLCAGCGEEKPAAPRGPIPTWCPPCKRAEGHRKRREDPGVRERHLARNAAWKAANPERHRHYQRKHSRTTKYGMTEADLLALYTSQAGACAICAEPHALDALVIDHDHACCPGPRSCGACVRGLLCPNCNLLLGHALDDAARLQAAVAYLTASAPERSLAP